MKRLFSRSMAVLLLLGVSLSAQTQEEIMKLNNGETIVSQGKIAYSLPWAFDYDKDGELNHVVMGAHLFIKQTTDGKYIGFLERGLFDIDNNVSVGWYLNRTLLQQPPKIRDISVKNVEHKGKTIAFDIEKTRISIMDGGEGHMRDKVVVDDHVKEPSILTIYDGDIQINPSK